jgi:hypothetical protein
VQTGCLLVAAQEFAYRVARLDAGQLPIGAGVCHPSADFIAFFHSRRRATFVAWPGVFNFPRRRKLFRPSEEADEVVVEHAAEAELAGAEKYGNIVIPGRGRCPQAGIQEH